MIKPLSAMLLLLVVSLTLSSCSYTSPFKPEYPKEFYEEAPYKVQRKILTVKDAGKEVSYLKKELQRVKDKLKALSPYKD